MLEDPLVYPKKWLRPDLVPPAPLLNCNPEVTVNGSGVPTVSKDFTTPATKIRTSESKARTKTRHDQDQ